MMSIEIIDSSDDDLPLLAVSAVKHVDHVKGEIVRKRGKPRKVHSSTEIDKQQPCKEKRARGRPKKTITNFSESPVNNSQSPINNSQSPINYNQSVVSCSPSLIVDINCSDQMPDDLNIVKESELTRYAVIVCKICKETFYNQLQIVMHNISHLTVKLELLPFCKCPYCSANVLTQRLSRHKKTCTALTKENILSGFPNVERNTITEVPTKPLKRSKGVNLSNNIVFEDSDIVHDCIDLDYSLLKPVEQVKDQTDEKERLTMHLQNLVNGCNVDLNINNKMRGGDGEGRVNGMLPDTVPFEELIKKEINPCKYCLKSFDSRYELCRHEQKHLKLRDCFVPFCIACGLRTMRLYSHAMCRPCSNDTSLVQFYGSFVRCEHCESVFYDETSLVMHRKNAHNTETYQFAVKRHVEVAPTPKVDIDHVLTTKSNTVSQETTKTNEKKGKFKSTVITICEMCHLLGSKTNYANGRYIFLADVEKSRLTGCGKCGGKFRSMKVVKVVWWSAKRGRKTDDKNYKCKPKNSLYVSALSNVERLLNIQQRFKKMRKGLL